jgi:hypothetical protein
MKPKLQVLPSNRPARFRLAFILILLAGILATLAACGGEEPQPQPTPEESTEAETQPQESPAEATVPEATAQPTTPPPTAEPTAEPTLPPTDEPTEVAGMAGGDCANAYFPVVEGQIYRYSSDFAEVGVSEYTITFTDVSDTSFTWNNDFGEGEPISVVYTCSAEGLLSPEFAQFPTGMEGFDIEYVEVEGQTLPPEEDFQPGHSWTTHYVANATFSDESGSMTMIQTIDLSHTIAGFEPVSVPAGDYPEAARVETTGTVSSEISIEGSTVPGLSLDMSFVTWYVEGVGMVRQDIGDLLGTGTGATELLAIE